MVYLRFLIYQINDYFNGGFNDISDNIKQEITILLTHLYHPFGDIISFADSYHISRRLKSN